MKNQTPKWKRAGPNGELEIKFPTGRRFMIEKQLDENERHKGDWKIMEWDTRNRDWEWHDTYSPKWYAKEMVMRKGQYDKKGKKVADYSSTFQSESIVYEEVTTAADAGIPQDTANMGPRFRPTAVTDRRRKKQMVLLKRFRKYMEDNG